MAKSLPLSIDRVNATSRKNALFYKPLPIYLILILFARKFLGDLENLNELSYRESGPLSWQLFHLIELHLWVFVCSLVCRILRILNLHDDIVVNGKSFTFVHHVNQPLPRHNIPRIIFFNRNLAGIDIVCLVHGTISEVLDLVASWLKQLDGEAFNQVSHLSSITVYEFNLLFVNVWHVEDQWNMAKHGYFLWE